MYYIHDIWRYIFLHNTLYDFDFNYDLWSLIQLHYFNDIWIYSNNKNIND